MQRFALYALCAAATALAVWLVLANLEPGASGDRAGEPSADVPALAERERAGAAARMDPLADPELGAEPDELEDLEDLEDLEAGDAPSGGDAFGANAGAPSAPSVPDAPRGGGTVDARAPVQTGSGGSAPVGTVPPPGDPRVVRPLDDTSPDPSDATPIEPEPEDTGFLADPEVKSRILENFPEDPLAPQ